MQYMVARRFGPEEETELVRLYESGWTQAQLAEHFGTIDLTVRRTLQRTGVAMRPRGGRHRSLTDEQKQEIESCYPEGESQDALARRLGISQSKVSNHLRKVGLRSGRSGREGTRHPLWKGGRVSLRGYAAVLVDVDDPLMMAMSHEGGYVMEHRLVVARSIGRPLESHETVHHINGDRQDNRIENLELWTGRHGKGVRHDEASAHCPTCTCFVR